MSLLRRGTETVTVFAEEDVVVDGAIRTRPSSVGVVCRAAVQPVGTPTEEWDGGVLTKSQYRLRLCNWPGEPLGAQSLVEWRGRRYAVVGEPQIYTGSRQTAHVDYIIERR